MSNVITRDMWDFASGMIQTAADMANFHGAHEDDFQRATGNPLAPAEGGRA